MYARLIGMKVLRLILLVVLCLVSCGSGYDLVIPVALRGDWENVDQVVHVDAMSDDIHISFYGEGGDVSLEEMIASDPLSYEIVASDSSFAVWHIYKSSQGFSFNLVDGELVMTYALEEVDGLSEVRLERQGG